MNSSILLGFPWLVHTDIAHTNMSQSAQVVFSSELGWEASRTFLSFKKWFWGNICRKEGWAPILCGLSHQFFRWWETSAAKVRGLSAEFILCQLVLHVIAALATLTLLYKVFTYVLFYNFGCETFESHLNLEGSICFFRNHQWQLSFLFASRCWVWLRRSSRLEQCQKPKLWVEKSSLVSDRVQSEASLFPRKAGMHKDSVQLLLMPHPWVIASECW